MRWAQHVRRMQARINALKNLAENLKDICHMEDLSVYVKIFLKDV